MSAPAAARAMKLRDRVDGLPCPVCGTRVLAVTDSRGRGGRIWRRRMCANGHRFSTIEILDDGGRSAQLNGLVALIDGLSVEDFVMVAGLAARLSANTPSREGDVSGHPDGSGAGGLSVETDVACRHQPGSEPARNVSQSLESVSLTHATEHEVGNGQEVGQVPQGVRHVVTN